jgi:hypothetical protein
MMIHASIYRLVAIVLLIVAIVSCAEVDQDTLFVRHKASKSGIDFQNRLTEKPELNIFNYLYFYNGGGVAVADFDGDGYQDIYFTANQEANKLYLNKGGFRFDDVTQIAGVAGLSGWTTGTTAVDINADGRMDIYVCMVSEVDAGEARNLLFINEGNNEEGIPVFREAAASYGLDFQGYSTQALFFDYDLDQDLDLFLLNHSVHGNGTFAKATARTEFHPSSGDRLYENTGNGFRDITQQSGIYSSVLGYGLGVVSSDINGDGYPDIYVANDFHEDDYLYINQGDGTFKDVRPTALQHTTRFSMGADIADINNDALPDILSLDMLPEDPEMLKASAAEDPYDVYQFKLNYGYNHQYARNALQLNRGNGQFSQISLYADIAATDWSWAALMADFDLDGLKDMVVSNGIKRRSNDMDYINYISNDAIQMKLDSGLSQQDMSLVESLPVVKIPNYAFKNLDGLRFEDVSTAWGLGDESFSNGTAYADFDNDGDLDLVVNNIDQEAFIFENRSIDAKTERTVNYVKVKAVGPPINPRGIGVSIQAWVKGVPQLYELQAVRGYQSSVEPIAIIGLGETEKVDSLTAHWPGKGSYKAINVKSGTQLLLAYDNFKAVDQNVKLPENSLELMTSKAEEIGIAFNHKENRFVEFNREPLIPHMTSTEGPAVAYADVNGDGIKDLFLGNAKREIAELYLGQNNGSYKKIDIPAFESDAIHEDTDALFFDADMDGDLDLFVCSGGSEWTADSPYRSSRLYLNDGAGNFERKNMPEHFLNASAVVAFDYDQDGDLDLLLAERSKTWNYGSKGDAILFINNGDADFTAMTGDQFPVLKHFGMVTDMQVADIDADDKLEIVVAREWDSIRIVEVNNGQLVEDTDWQAQIEPYKGWWSAVFLEDVNADGIADLIVGNLGLNSRLKATKEQPVELFVNDYDGNGQEEQILTYYLKGERHLFATRDEITRQLPDIKKKYTKYADFAKARLEDLFEPEQISAAMHLEANTFANGVFVSGADGYRFVEFPAYLQFSSLQAFTSVQTEDQQTPYLIAAGNFYDVNPQMGRYDADTGSMIQWSKQENKFKLIEPTLGLDGQIRAMVHDQNGRILFVRNNQEVLYMALQRLLNK